MIAGRGPAPSLVVALVLGLPDTSLTVALATGGREFHGWGRDRYLLADLYDALNANTRATGNWGKKPPNIKPYPRPEPKREKRKVTVASLWQRFAAKT